MSTVFLLFFFQNVYIICISHVVYNHHDHLLIKCLPCNSSVSIHLTNVRASMYINKFLSSSDISCFVQQNNPFSCKYAVIFVASSYAWCNIGVHSKVLSFCSSVIPLAGPSTIASIIA